MTLNCSSLAAAFRCSTSSRARRSSLTASKASPASGTSAIPVISTGTEGPADLTPVALVVGHDANTSDGRSRNHNVAVFEGSVLHKQGGDGAAALVKSRLDDSSLCGTVGVGL